MKSCCLNISRIRIVVLIIIAIAVIKEIEDKIKPGMSTWEVDQIAEKMIRSLGAIPAEKGYNPGIKGIPPYPASICISVNDEVVHGIPKKDFILEEGDIVSMDAGLIYQGYHAALDI